MNPSAKDIGREAYTGAVTGVFNYCGPMDEPPLFCGDQQERTALVSNRMKCRFTICARPNRAWSRRALCSYARPVAA